MTVAGKDHLLYLTFEADSGNCYAPKVECPDEAMGVDRPCAVWADDSGEARFNECVFQQYADACPDLEDWLHGMCKIGPIRIGEGAAGMDWHAEIREDEPS